MKQRRVLILIAMYVAIITISIGLALYYYRQYTRVIGDSQKVEEVQTQAMLNKIATVMDLPAEKPSVITITDREKLQSQEFFKKAQNGDKIIIYEAARRVILYRPSTGHVVDVAPLIFNNQTSPAGTSENVLPQATIPSPTATLNPTPPNASPSGNPFK